MNEVPKLPSLPIASLPIWQKKSKQIYKPMQEGSPRQSDRNRSTKVKNVWFFFWSDLFDSFYFEESYLGWLFWLICWLIRATISGESVEVRAISAEEAEKIPVDKILLPTPGFKVLLPANECKDWYTEMLAEDGFTMESLRQKSKWV